MNNDISKIRKQFKGEKIVTKHEWMIAAIEALEKEIPNKRDDRDETPEILYDALFIDPCKLTPYQQS